MRRGFLKNPKAVRDKTKLQSRPQEPFLPVQNAQDAHALALATAASIKLPHGNVESAALPEGYVPGKLAFPDADALKARNTATTSLMVMTSIPPMPLSGSLDPDGHCKCIVSVETKFKVLNTRGFPQSVPKPIGLPSYVVQSTAKMGMGVFATRDIKVGELIFAERPLLVSPVNIGRTVNLPREYDAGTTQTIAMLEFEKQLEVLLGRMAPEDQTAFQSLMNNHKEDGSGPLLGIVRTNAYGIENLFDGPEKMPLKHNLYGGVAKIGSRFNHSCMPNVTRDFSIPSFSFKFSAIRDIKAGEQLFSAYCAMNQTVAERRAELAPYGFACECSSCVNATPETDKLRKEYSQLAKDYASKITQCIISPNKDESVLDPILRLREALVQEGLQGSQEFALLVSSIYHFYKKLGMQGKANLYAKEYTTYKVLFAKPSS